MLTTVQRKEPALFLSAFTMLGTMLRAPKSGSQEHFVHWDEKAFVETPVPLRPRCNRVLITETEIRTPKKSSKEGWDHTLRLFIHEASRRESIWQIAGPIASLQNFRVALLREACAKQGNTIYTEDFTPPVRKWHSWHNKKDRNKTISSQQ